jgi:hypothetical protein
MALLTLHSYYNLAQNLKSYPGDLTLEKAQWFFDFGRWFSAMFMVAVCCGIGTVVGIITGAVLWGMVTGVICSLPVCVSFFRHSNFGTSERARWKVVRLVTFLFLGPPLIGVSLDTVKGSWLPGLIIGGIVSGLMGVILLFSWKANRWMR